MPVRVEDIDVDLASAIAGSMLWLRMQDLELVAQTNIDRCMVLDLYAICREHDIEFDPHTVIAVMVQMGQTHDPDEFTEDYYQAQQRIISLLRILKHGKK